MKILTKKINKNKIQNKWSGDVVRELNFALDACSGF